MLEPVLKNPWVRALGAAAALLLVALVCYVLSPILISLFLAFLVAYVLNPVVDYFERRRIPRAITIAGLVVFTLLGLLAIPLIVLPSIVAQAQSLQAREQQESNEREQRQNERTQEASDEDAQQEQQDEAGAWLDNAVEFAHLDAVVRALGWAPRERKWGTLWR